MAGYVLVAGDCDDSDAATNPAALDTCDGVDRDCNGIPDDDAIEQTWYEDSDGDGFGDDGVAVGSCASIPGFSLNAGDCDDQDAGVSPAIVDVCDGVDTNCNGVVDDDATFSIWFEDGDGDGSGDAAVQVEACAAPSGFVQVSGDCDDGDPGVRPGAVDLCDGLDQDCDGAVDEGASFSTFYEDADGDGLGAIGVPTSTCDGAPAGFVAQPGDCDDADAGVTIPIWYVDDDGDGFGTEVSTELACVQPAGFAAQRDDCDDSDPDANPGEVEVCNNVRDDDCSAVTDCRRTGTVLTSDADLSFVLPDGVGSTQPIPDLFGSDSGDWVFRVDGVWTVFAGPVPDFSSGFDLPCDPTPQPLSLGDLTGDGRFELGCIVGDTLLVLESGGLASWTVQPQAGAPEIEAAVLSDGPFGAGVWLAVGSELQFFQQVPPGQVASTVAHSISCPDTAAGATKMEVAGEGVHLVALCSSGGSSGEEAFFYPDSGFGSAGPADAAFSLEGVGRRTEPLQNGEGVLVEVDIDSSSGALDLYFASYEPPLMLPLAPTSYFDPPPNSAPISVPIGDLDGNGVQDWITLPGDTPTLFQAEVVYPDDPAIDFTSVELIFLAQAGSELTQMSGATTDVDGDGFEDFVLSDAEPVQFSQIPQYGPETVRVFFGSGQ